MPGLAEVLWEIHPAHQGFGIATTLRSNLQGETSRGGGIQCH